eukprot:CAMPEP_0194279658 /NCGR_PEP_ID=MMETSP0169-20130528/14052_1 /TAXON_ID=218684 /ORGANISM="Corethron pennatum, Strain L29A3" /LENGTH=339 /DNA_ID=CAMNT_0039024105 /DNA_START=18 /DNA_END=1037 /DNA_ORIENTATION=+
MGTTDADFAAAAPKAFCLVIAAGLATGLGAGVVFSDRLISLADRRALAACLGAAAGVMLYVSFLDIFGKSLQAFEEAHDPGAAYAYATLTFFGGFGLYAAVGRLVSCLNPGHHCHDDAFLDAPPPPVPDRTAHARDKGDDDTGTPSTAETTLALEATVTNSVTNATLGALEAATDALARPVHTAAERAALRHTGVVTALSVALHNFPEGLVTFVGYVADPALGVSLAVAIALHNLPEGLCVAVPLYYATGSRRRAFAWAMVSGLSEMLGGALGWLVLGSHVSPTAFGLSFGIVGGMMVAICVVELLPTAHRYDPEDVVTTKALVGGMAVMATSLVLLNL